jgi:hypothetical protein
MHKNSTEYLFRFGFCTPAQWAANSANGWDDESSGAFFVCAGTAEQALQWGRRVVNAWVREQFADAGMESAPSWEKSEFASWIDDAPADAFDAPTLQNLPRVAVGETPDFKQWIPY